MCISMALFSTTNDSTMPKTRREYALKKNPFTLCMNSLLRVTTAKRCKRKSRGAKDQLSIDKAILRNSKKSTGI